MLVVETIARIRREFFVKGRSIKEIVRDLKVSRNTVRKVLRSGETSFSYEREVQPLPRLGRWRADLDRLLSSTRRRKSSEQGRTNDLALLTLGTRSSPMPQAVTTSTTRRARVSDAAAAIPSPA